MFLVDSTVWIDYFNGDSNIQTAYLDLTLGHEEIVIGDIILGEVLQGFRADQDFERARQALLKFQQVPLLSPELAVQSARNYRFLRQRAVTVRKTIDCFIATYCIQNRLPLLHNDRDFDPFEKHLGLPIVQAGRKLSE